ncbi:hypothetical protein CKO25_09915 [Thiocapsa imhoffii]|uniref:Uncharacterized protein n=1 Tax=Thiocapsa imhoffii TaxID=382777 RepID=A0A9X1B9F0_9GAMM|nr:hypothetical protein [Thiocapsa imhoffii]MBK1644961.1 hypothetical protein [Thiocapsa imhoffii]
MATVALKTTTGRLLLILALSAEIAAAPQPRAGPGILLFQATVEEAREVALASATASGWVQVDATTNSIDLEHLIEDEDIHDPRAPKTLIRIQVIFSDEPMGTRVLLQAMQVQSADDRLVTSDVTARYAENLDNALNSLRRRWDLRRGAQGASVRSPEPRQASEPRQAAVGIWAYYAERYAIALGCELGHSGAILAQSGSDWERHRVPCHDGRILEVICHHGDCTQP